MLDADVFVRPIAHRGFHDVSSRRIENSASAFAATIERGYGIECDLQPSAEGVPMVFHDFTLDRLTGEQGRIADQPVSRLERLRYSGSDDRISRFSDLLDQVGGRVPLIVEIKSEWAPLPPSFLGEIAARAGDYKGPLALMSFDPAVMTDMRGRVPQVPRGIVSGVYSGPGWSEDRLSPERREALTHLLESGPAAPDFYSYHVKALPTPVTRFVREVLRVPLFSWTVRTPQEREIAARWSDAPTFEGWEP